MASQEIHDEIGRWKKPGDNLIGWKLFQYNHTFSWIYWLTGVLLVIFAVFLQEGAQRLGNWVLMVSIIFFGASLLFLIKKIAAAQKQADEDIKYLYQKKDGQKV